MKKILFLICCLICTQSIWAQGTERCTTDLPAVQLGTGVSLHLVSPEPIEYVDISSDRMAGDLPVENVLRLKFLCPEEGQGDGGLPEQPVIVTVVGQTFMAQYAVYRSSDGPSVSRMEILPGQMQPLDFPGVGMGLPELKAFALKVARQKHTYHDVKSRRYGMQASLNNIFACGDYIFVDVTFKNRTRIKYDVDEFHFRLKDKRITRSTNVQDVELKPLCSLYDLDSFERSYRNVFVFKKFTFPGNKVFSVELSERQVSGRAIELLIDYSDLLHADTL